MFVGVSCFLKFMSRLRECLRSFGLMSLVPEPPESLNPTGQALTCASNRFMGFRGLGFRGFRVERVERV